MKALLVTGEVIRPQVWISNDAKTSAVEFPEWLKNPKRRKRRNLRFATLSEDTEYVQTEEFSVEDFRLLLGLYALKMKHVRARL